ncbi:MAG: DUF1501 domain-containing protein [Betaproteobacteria bacterium]
MIRTRRSFLRRSAVSAVALAASGGLPFTLATMAAAATRKAAPVTDYKALVCVFLFGGNDGNNLLIPYGTSDHATYATGRGSLAIARDQLTATRLAPVNTGGREFALHPSMTRLATLFGQGRAAVLANAGPLVQPLTKAQWSAGSAPVPPNLFSHSDQQSAWQIGTVDSAVRTGWGGRLVDLFQSQNSIEMASCISTAGRSTFLTGQSAAGFSIASNGNFGFDFYQSDAATDPLSVGFRELMGTARSHMFEKAFVDTLKGSLETQRLFSQAIDDAPAMATQFPRTGLGDQLATVARMIAARNLLGIKRQAFFVTLGGFDTHGNGQRNDQQDLLGEVSQAIGAFYDATVELGVAPKVTTFTQSDFGRDFPANGNGGSDHGWGNHHLVVGGAVQGQKLYGTFPTLAVGGPDDATGGRWIPTTGVDQYSATMAKWFGVDAADMTLVAPNIGRFATADLGFFG